MRTTLARGCDTVGVTDTTLPRWDVSDLYPSLTSREFVSAQEELRSEVDRLEALYDTYRVGADATSAVGVDDVIGATNRVHRSYNTLAAVAMSVVSTDSQNLDGQRAQSELRAVAVRIGQLSSRLTAWAGGLGAVLLIRDGGPIAADHAWPLARLESRAIHQMTPTDEHLYAELAATGSTAWSQLYNDVTSQLTVRVGEAVLPIAALRNRASSPDRALRREAYEAELAAWPTVATPLAAAMNAIKGEANAVNTRRKWDSPLDASLYANSVSRPTFNAMQAAVIDHLGDFRRWMRVKARLHNREGGALAWYDMFAPLPVSDSGVTWAEGTARVEAAFAEFSPSLAHVVRRAIAERWIDVEPRAGKRGGAFCASIHDDRSLVLLNWDGSLNGASTLAHELGHAYHNTQLAHRTPLQRQLPMALAETASIFCETLFVEAGLRTADPAQRLALLDLDLQGSTQVVVDIHSRLLFETEVFARRQRRALPAVELCELMADAQEQAYGDGLDPEMRHPWMWAAKPHYYNSHFYNWPYCFGLLFGLGLHTLYVANPERFRGGYDDLLSSVALAPAEELGRRFGFDLESEDFWQSSLTVICRRMDDYERLAQPYLT